MDIDDILKKLGECGKYQQLLLWFVLLPAVIPCAFHAYLQIFLSLKPNHWCYIPELSHMRKDDSRNLSIPIFNNEFAQCEMFERNYSTFLSNDDADINNKTTYCKNGWVFDTNEYTSTVVVEWDLVCEKDFMTTIALIVFGVGGLVGNYIFGYIQDSIGRKPAFFIYLSIEVLFSILSVFSWNFWIWCFLRFGVGLTVPAILGTPMVLALELVGPSKRTMVFILVNIAFSIGLVLLAGVVYFFRNWRQLTLVTSLPFLFFFLFFGVMPESPRWLLAKRRYKEAEIILMKIGKINGRTFDKNIFTQLEELNDENSQSKEDVRKYGVTDLFERPVLRKKTIIITFIWLINTAVYVGLSYYAPALGGDEFLNFFLGAIVELPTYFILWPAMEKIGRRWILCVSMIIGGVACLTTFLVQQNKILTLILYCIGKMGISSSFVAVPLVASELYPTVVRGIGLSFSGVIAQIGPILIPIINYSGEDYLVLPLIIMGGLLIVGGFCSLFLPETLRQHLPQNIEDSSKKY